jgi:TonB family protein
MTETMSYATSDSDDLTLKPFLVYSVFFHLFLTTAMLLSVWLQRSGTAWGGIGGGSDSGVKVSLVSSAGIPMPQPTVPSESDVVDPTKGLNKEEPTPKPPEPKNDATKISKFEKNKPLPPSKPSKTFTRKSPVPENAVPYGKGGGQLNLPSGYSDMPGPPAGGLSAIGQGGGDFAARYGWYIESVKRAINQNWLQNTIDPGVRAARRAHCVVNFSILRDGTIKNIRLSQSSGNQSMDNSAQRALLSIDRLPALPSDYSGTYVDVIFDFDLGMSK